MSPPTAGEPASGAGARGESSADQAIDAVLRAVSGTGDAPTGLPVQAAVLIAGDDPVLRLCGGQLAARALVDSGDIVGATRLVGGLLDLALGWEARLPARGPVLQTLIPWFAGLANDSGRGREVYERAPAWMAILESLGNPGHVSDLRLKAAEALLEDGHYERALFLTDQEPPDGLRPDLLPVRTRLCRTLADLVRRADERLPAFDPGTVFRETLAFLAAAEPDAVLTKALYASGGETIDRNALGHLAFPPVPAGMEALDRASRALASSRAPLGALQAVFEGASAALQAGSSGPPEYRLIASVADRGADAAAALGRWRDAVSFRWLGTVALRRAGEHPAALAGLRVLAATIDERRTRIADPRLRAGLAVYLPHLPWIVAETALRVGDEAAAFFASEMAKARILGDLRKPNAAVAPGLLGALRDVAAALPRTHFLTFLSDTSAEPGDAGAIGVRAMLLASGGAVHAADVPLSEAAIRAAADEIDRLVRKGGPGDWGDIFKGDPWRRPFDALLALLAPLVAWLAPLLETGTLRTGDTVVVSADGSIHNVPLGMLPLAGAPLIAHFALVAMPSLAFALDPAVPPRPSAAAALLGPRPAERARGDTYEREIARLRALLPTTVGTSIEDVHGVLADPAGRLLHIAAHGTFSREAPLRSGGLVFPDRGGAYDPADPRFVLEPEELGEASYAGAHLTVRACLVGQARQVTSREALGLVWALLSAGASSIAAASWTVEIGSAARWCDYFYEAWLGQGQSRAQAHRTACLALRAEGGAFAHPCHWAAFVLYSGTIRGDAVWIAN